MKTKMLKGIVCFASLSLVASCSDGNGTGFDRNSGRGRIALTPVVDTSVKSSRASRAEYTDITVDDLTLKVTSADGSITKTFDNVSAFGESQEFNVGLYTVEAFYGSDDAQGFDAPYFYGSAQVKVEEDKTVSANLAVSLANSVISVEYGDKFVNYMTSWSAGVNDSYVLEQGNTRFLYLTPGEVSVDITFVKPNGNGGTVRVTSFTAQPRYHYHVKVDMAGDGSGVAEGISVTVDETLDEGDLPVIDISDDVLNAPLPIMAASGFSDGQPVEFVTGMKLDRSLAFNIIAQAGLQEVRLTTSSKSLTSQGWPAELNFMAADAAMQQTLESLGLDVRGLYHNPEKLAVITFDKVLDHLSYIPGAASDDDNINTFTVRVMDKFNRVSEPLTLSLVASPVALSLENDELYVMGTTLKVDVRYNGGGPTGRVVFRYRDLNGVDREANPEYEKISDGLYRATLPVYASEKDFSFTVSAPGVADVSYTAVRRPQLFPAPGTTPNAFAKHAYIPVSIGTQDNNTQLLTTMMNAAKVYLSTDGTNYSLVSATADPATKTLHIAGLSPATSYKARIVNGDQTLEQGYNFAFTTETAAQIPNGNLDADVTVIESSGDWQNIGFQTWGTNNDMTTSQPTGGGLGIASNNKLCKAISGTVQTDDAHSGKAALIRSVGWGGSNTATGSSGTSGSCKYTDTGLLHLGATRSVRPVGYGENDNKLSASTSVGPLTTDDLDCGIEFASRPSAISFWYKYSPKNTADKGSVEVWLKDVSGNVIASATLLLDAVDTYTRKSIDLDFNQNTAKCVKLYVKFVSSYDMEYYKRTNDNFSGPGFAGSDPFMGSQLYIDDIELTY